MERYFNTTHRVERFDYKEAGPQLLLQAFLQRIVNGGGRIDLEYGLGRRDPTIPWDAKIFRREDQSCCGAIKPGASSTSPSRLTGKRCC